MTPLANPPSLEALESLRSAVAENLHTLQAPSILGAQLGTMLNGILSPTNYKTWLNEGSQNLRSFAEAFLKGIVAPTQDRQGFDYFFKVESGSQQIIQSFGGALWKSFCATRPTANIFFDTKQGALFLLPVGSNEVVNGQPVAGISEQEHKSMCLKFAELLDQEGRASQLLLDTAKGYETSSFPVWVACLKAVPKLYKEWGIQRAQWVKDLFSQRIDELTEDEATRARLNAEFHADHTSHPEVKPVSIGTQSLSAIAHVASSRPSSQATRQMLTQALDSLDDAHLSRILVPLDVVAALLAKHKQ